MGFDIYYSTVEQISPGLQREIIDEADDLYAAKSWIQCDGPNIENEDGYLSGASLLSPSPDPDDVEEARADGCPDGRVFDLLDALCVLSSRHDIEWEISHTHSDGIVGSIECGRADESVVGAFDGLAAMCEGLSDGELSDDFEFPDDLGEAEE